MALSLYWPGRYFFYPIGNTSAVDLTRDISPDAPADLLLNPVGDARNVLYTLYCQDDHARRKLDFTCCDYDVGVLARNVLLFSMILDDVPSKTIWNIVFHMSLDPASTSILTKQCRKLLAHSHSHQDWEDSPYGPTLRFGSDHTLSEVRRLWTCYATFNEAPEVGQQTPSRRLRDIVKTSQADVLHEYGTHPHITSTRSVGPFMMKAQDIYTEIFRRFWKTGTTFVDPEKASSASQLNPTFCYSRAGEGFNVHYGTTPITPFHLAPVFGNAHHSVTLSEVLSAAHSEFKVWCSAFKASVAKAANQPIVRVLLGDAIAVAHALRSFPDHKPPKYRVFQWSAQELQLSEDEYVGHCAPTRFDVIDTSNLCDHVGVLNVLVPAALLLSSSFPPKSTLYTENLLSHSANSINEFASKMLCDLSTAALLFDLVPVDLVSGFVTKSNTHEVLLSSITTSTQYHQTITWKKPSGGDFYLSTALSHPHSIVFHTNQLALLFHQIYSDLFGDENPIQFYRDNASNIRRAINRISSSTHTRESFVIFLGFVHARLRISDVQWNEVMNIFVQGLHDLRAGLSPFDKLYQSEVHAQLYRHEVFLAADLNNVTSPTKGRLSNWSRIPALQR